MPKTREQKEQIVKNIKQLSSQAQSVIFAVFSNLTVEKMNILRKDLKQQKAKMQIIKKRLLKKALVEILPQTIPHDYLQNALGSICTAWSSNETTAAKITENFAKENKQYKILGGILFNQDVSQVRYLSLDEIKNLAALPTREQLIVKFIQNINSPLNGLVNILGGNMRNFIEVLRQISLNKK